MELDIILCMSLLLTCANGNCNNVLEEMYFFERLMKPCGEQNILDGNNDLDADRKRVETEHLIYGIKMDIENLHLLMISPQCDGLSLNTLPPLPQSMDDKAEEMIYAAFIYQVAHIFSISREHLIFPLTCSNHSQHLAYGFRKLGGKLLLLQCFIDDDRPMVGEKQKTRFLYRNECSARQTRDCVVLKRTLDVLNLVIPFVLRNNFTNVTNGSF